MKYLRSAMSHMRSDPQDGHGVAIYFTLPAEEFVRQTGETSAMSIACNFTEAGEAKAEAWVKPTVKKSTRSFRMYRNPRYKENLTILRR